MAAGTNLVAANTTSILALPGKVSRVGLQLPSDLSYEEWEAIGLQLKNAESAVMWWVGDWLNFGESTYGKTYEQAMGATGYAYQTLKAAKWVSSKFEMVRRITILEWGHHQAVAALDLEDADSLLQLAADNGLSVKEMRHAVVKWKREQKHAAIAEDAVESSVDGTFPLIYADPPWEFSTYSEKGKENSPDKHYPTLDDDAIKAFEVNGRSIPELAHKSAAVFLWCTSSNISRALDVMDAWNFTYKTHAVWDKERTGTGYIFLNQHELLLYGTRGEIPAPMAIRSSVFQYPRGRHSEKPPEIRAALDEMYPRFGKENKIELFAREAISGWTVDGYEAG